MLDLKFEAVSPLGGYHRTFEGAELEEASALAIISLAIPLGGGAAFVAALSATFGTTMPAPASSTLGADGKTRFVWMSPDQLFFLTEQGGRESAAVIGEKLGGTVYVTEQSDSWAALRLSGPKAREALARICPIDLHPDVFPEDRVARTVMEHLNVVILREQGDRFLLLSASSSAGSFLHAIETSIENVT